MHGLRRSEHTGEEKRESGPPDPASRRDDNQTLATSRAAALRKRYLHVLSRIDLAEIRRARADSAEANKFIKIIINGAELKYFAWLEL